MVVLGGMGTVIGPVIGAALLLLEEFIPEGLDLVRAGWGEHWRIVLGPLCWRSCCSRRAGSICSPVRCGKPRARRVGGLRTGSGGRWLTLKAQHALLRTEVSAKSFGGVVATDNLTSP